MITIYACDDNTDFLKSELKPALCHAAQSLNLKISLSCYLDGLALIRKFENGDIPDIVILDIEMPTINGKELARKLREIDRAFCLIFVSSYPNEVFDTIRYQIDAFIPKTFGTNNYLSEFKRVLKTCYEKQSCYEIIDIYRNGELVSTKIPIDNILGFYMYNHNIYIKTLTSDLMIKETVFRNIACLFFQKGFVECSRNHIINVKRIKEVRQDCVVFDNNDSFPISRRKVKDLLSAFNNSILEEMTF